MTKLLRLGAAAALAWAPLACGQPVPPEYATDGPPSTLHVAGDPGPPLQVAGDSASPAGPKFMQCDGGEVRSGDMVLCFDTARRTWQEAEDHCRLIGGHLLELRSSQEAQFLKASFGMQLDLPNTLWIGLVEPFHRGEWMWMGGQKATYQNWNTGEPNDSGGGEDCGERISQTGKWNDIDCAVSRGFICEGPPMTGKGKSTFKCTGTAVQAGNIPYCVYTDRTMTLSAADQFCKAQGGVVAELSSPEKDRALRDELGPRMGDGDDVWIGLTDARKEGSWVNAKGDGVQFTQWRGGEPNDAGGNEDCAMWGPRDGMWNDVPCDLRAQSICRGVADPSRPYAP